MASYKARSQPQAQGTLMILIQGFSLGLILCLKSNLFICGPTSHAQALGSYHLYLLAQF